jgi:hypothetical protein
MLYNKRVNHHKTLGGIAMTLVLGIVGSLAFIGLVGFCLLCLIAGAAKPETVRTTVRYVNCTEEEFETAKLSRGAKQAVA